MIWRISEIQITLFESVLFNVNQFHQLCAIHTVKFTSQKAKTHDFKKTSCKNVKNCTTPSLTNQPLSHQTFFKYLSIDRQGSLIGNLLEGRHATTKTPVFWHMSNFDLAFNQQLSLAQTCFCNIHVFFNYRLSLLSWCLFFFVQNNKTQRYI